MPKEAEQAKRKALNELEHQTLVTTRDQTLKDYLVEALLKSGL